MQKAIKILTVVVAIALIIVIGLIITSTVTQKNEETEEMNTNISATQETAVSSEDDAQNAANEANDDMTTGEASNEAQNDEAQNEPMYEGALAGMTEEEIARLALAEEQSNHETEGESND